MDYRLVTYQCLHFKVVAQHDYNLNIADDFSIECLFSTPTSSQRHSEAKCGSTECESISKEEWSSRIHKAIYQCKQYLSIAVYRYFEEAFRYHSTAPGTRVSTLSIQLCETAHQQFGIENRPWDDDPFFEAWQGSADTLFDLEQEALGDVDNHGCAELVAVINKTRGILSGIQGRIACLAQGVAIIHATQLQQQKSGEWARVVEKPGAKLSSSGKRKETRALNSCVSPMQVFGRAVYGVWEQRMLGLWEAFNVD